MLTKRLIINGMLGVSVVALGIGAYSTVGTSATSSGAITNLVTAKTGIVVQTVSATGNVTVPAQVSATFAQAGTVVAIMVKQGDLVAAGQPLAKIDDTTQQAALTVAQNSLAATQAAIAKVNAGLAPADQTQLDVALQQANINVLAAKATLDAAYTSAGQDAASTQSALNTAVQSLDTANAQLATDVATQTEDLGAYGAAQATLDAAKPADESSNATLIRYQHDQDICAAKDTPTDGVQCGDLAYLTRLFQAVVAQDKAATADNNAVRQAQTALATAEHNKSAAATKDGQAAAGATRSVDSSNLNLVVTTESNTAKRAAPAADVVAQQATQLAQAQNAVAAAHKSVDDTVLKAPTAGTIIALNGIVGLGSSAGSASSSSASGTGSSSSSGSTSSAFATIVDLGNLQVKAGFAEADAAKIVPGLAANINFDALPNVTATAKVSSVDYLSTVSSNVVTYNVLLTLDSVPPGVKPGMTSTAGVVADHRDNVVTLPTSAVSTRGTNATVTVRGKDGKESQVRITIGLRGDDSVEITSGLSAGDVVVVRTSISGGGTSTRGGTGAGTGTGAFPGGPGG